MPINPVLGPLQNVGDTVTALLTGDPTALLSLSGSFTNGVFIVEGSSIANPGAWATLPDVQLFNGQYSAGQFGPLSNPGAGAGILLRADVGGMSQVRIRLISMGSGLANGGVATIPFPYSSAVQVVTGIVGVSGGAVDAQGQIQLVQELLPYNLAAGAPVLPGSFGDVPGDQLEGMFQLDNRVRNRLDRIEEWLKRLQMTIVLSIKAPEMSIQDVLASVNTDMASGEDHFDTQYAGDYQTTDVG